MLLSSLHKNKGLKYFKLRAQFICELSKVFLEPALISKKLISKNWSKKNCIKHLLSKTFLPILKKILVMK